MKGKKRSPKSKAPVPGRDVRDVVSRNSHPRSRLIITIDAGGRTVEFNPAAERVLPFEQLEPRREGLGLGLAISKAIVEMHGGTIRAQNQASNEVATFSIALPTSIVAL